MLLLESLQEDITQVEPIDLAMVESQFAVLKLLVSKADKLSLTEEDGCSKFDQAVLTTLHFGARCLLAVPLGDKKTANQALAMTVLHFMKDMHKVCLLTSSRFWLPVLKLI